MRIGCHFCRNKMNSPIQSLPIRDSKYVRHYKFLENYPWTYLLYQNIELCRWTLNRILLYQPLSCASFDCNANYCEYHPWRCKCRCYKIYLHVYILIIYTYNQYFYLIAISRNVFVVLLLATIGVSIVLMLDDNENTGEAIGWIYITNIIFNCLVFWTKKSIMEFIFWFCIWYVCIIYNITIHNIVHFLTLRYIHLLLLCS